MDGIRKKRKKFCLVETFHGASLRCFFWNCRENDAIFQNSAIIVMQFLKNTAISKMQFYEFLL